MRSAGVKSLHYSDRYLLQVYAVRCLSDALSSTPGAREADIVLDVAPDERPMNDSRFVHHNLPAGSARLDVLKALLPGAKVHLRHKFDMPHYRAITVHLADGRRIEIFLDQGFGA